MSQSTVELWYSNPQWWAVTVSVISMSVAGILTAITFRLTRATHSTYQCDSMFLEMQKLLLDDPALYEFYNVSDMEPPWSERKVADKRLYIFTEMHYFHFAFVYREYHAKRVPESYWKLYNNWLGVLVNESATFEEVHVNERNHFEEEFVSHVDKLLENKKPKKKPKKKRG